MGGIARYDLDDGTWSLDGTNPGLILFGLGATVVPEPSSLVMLGLGLTGGLVAVRRSRRHGS
ncbi:PEP-CTERM sorting domain-containing protein [Tautonia rosea]|uniref:PEP-CTERM sorting domain-containing protein n=1 Tax=Tautonia rosea TaxID=2728037 RepID=UPI0019CFFEFE|nr:PEP-CTERM sorting domain-containing protein [Tautonia rosea]